MAIHSAAGVKVQLTHGADIAQMPAGAFLHTAHIDDMSAKRPGAEVQAECLRHGPLLHEAPMVLHSRMEHSAKTSPALASSA